MARAGRDERSGSRVGCLQPGMQPTPARLPDAPAAPPAVTTVDTPKMEASGGTASHSSASASPAQASTPARPTRVIEMRSTNTSPSSRGLITTAPASRPTSMGRPSCIRSWAGAGCLAGELRPPPSLPSPAATRSRVRQGGCGCRGRFIGICCMSAGLDRALCAGLAGGGRASEEKTRCSAAAAAMHDMACSSSGGLMAWSHESGWAVREVWARRVSGLA